MEIYKTDFIPPDIDCFIFILNKNDYLSYIKYIEKLLKIKLPDKIFHKFFNESGNIRETYFNKFSIIFGSINDSDLNSKYLFNTIHTIGKKIRNSSYKHILFDILFQKNTIINLIESIFMSTYNFTRYSQKKQIDQTIFIYTSEQKFNKLIDYSFINGKIINITRNLVNEPANILNSTQFVKIIKNAFRNTNIDVEIIHKEELKKKKLNLILAVNSGSKFPPYLVILKNKNKSKTDTKSNVFVGKGVMFDAGGLNVKGSDIDHASMKLDMTGAAVVFSLFLYIKSHNIKGNFVGLLPLVENMLDSNSYRPGDVISSYSNKSVEIIDTDAEGRLILADSIAYSEIFNPKLIVDVATLTGAAGSIFNDLAIVLMGNDSKYNKLIIQSSKNCNEKIWEMPLWDEYIELTKAHISDLKNYDYSVKAGAIMGGAFLYNFVPKNVKWIHLDIAGPSYIHTENKYFFEGATGYGCRSLFRFIEFIRGN